MAKTDAVNIANPPGGSNPRLGDDYIRTLAKALIEFLAVNHYVGTATDNAYTEDDAGKHKLVTFRELQVSKPSLGGNDKGALYIKGATPEIYFEDAAGNEIQLTTGGKLNGAALSSDSIVSSLVLFLNNTFLRQKDSSGTARNLIGMDATDIIQVGDSTKKDCRLVAATADASANARQIVDKGFLESKIGTGAFSPLAADASGIIKFPNGNIEMSGYKAGTGTQTIDISAAGFTEPPIPQLTIQENSDTDARYAPKVKSRTATTLIIRSSNVEGVYWTVKGR